MSNFVVNPSEKTENLVYLAFSLVAVTSLFYYLRWYSVGYIAGYVPNPVLVTIISTLFASILYYTALDDYLVRRFLMNKVDTFHYEQSAFIALAKFVIRVWAIDTRKLDSSLAEYRKYTVDAIDGNEMNSSIWMLRGGIWFLLAIPFSVSLVSLFSDLQFPFSFIIWIGATIIIGLCIFIPIVREFRKVVKRSVFLGSFHWLDQAIANIGRTETTPRSGKTKVRLQLDGVSEAVYRGISGAIDREWERRRMNLPNRDHVPSVIKSQRRDAHGTGPEYSERSLSLRGEITDFVATTREELRAYRSRLSEECNFLHDLIKRRSWNLFLSRYVQLQKAIVSKSKNEISSNLLNLLIREWTSILIHHECTVKFSNLRKITHELWIRDFVPAQWEKPIWGLLRPSCKDMFNPRWAWEYYLKCLNCDERLKRVFVDYAVFWARKVSEDFPQEPDIPVEVEVDLVVGRAHNESPWSEGWHPFDGLPKDEVEKIEYGDIRLQDYDD